MGSKIRLQQEQAYDDYKKSVDNVNRALKNLPVVYCPYLERL